MAAKRKVTAVDVVDAARQQVGRAGAPPGSVGEDAVERLVHQWLRNPKLPADYIRLPRELVLAEADRLLAAREDLAEFEAAKQQVLLVRERERRKAEVQIENLRKERDRSIAASQRQLDQEVQRIQNEYKVWAALIPPIPPLVVGIIVWVLRRNREREGVSRTRRK